MDGAGTIVSVLLIGLAAFSVVGVMWFVLREQHHEEEYYNPDADPQPAQLDSHQVEGTTGAANLHAALEQQAKPDEAIPDDAAPKPKAYELDSRQMEGEIPPMDAQQAAADAAAPDQPKQD
jgi:hypothetical protein